MYPFYLGIDLHLKRTYMVLMDDKGTVIDKERISNQEITKYLQEKVPQETYAVLEATRNWRLHPGSSGTHELYPKGIRGN